MSEGFFSRWSRRKQQAGQGGNATASPTPAQQPAEDGLPPSARDGAPPDALGEAAGQGHPDPQALPTLDDVRFLTPESDFQSFMQQGVGTDVRNAAMKKLFTDPHFNVMDGLDIYIDDYSQPDPMPVGMLHKMASAQFLQLVPPEATQQNQPEEAATAVVAQSPDASALADPTEHDHPDLQLQPDPAPADPAAGSRPR